MCGGALYSMTLGAEETQIKLTLEKRRNSDKIETGGKRTPVSAMCGGAEHCTL